MYSVRQNFLFALSSVRLTIAINKIMPKVFLKFSRTFQAQLKTSFKFFTIPFNEGRTHSKCKLEVNTLTHSMHETENSTRMGNQVRKGVPWRGDNSTQASPSMQ